MRNLIDMVRGLSEGVEYFDETAVISDVDKNLFSAGYCHALALALHRKTGHPMIALVAKEGRRWAIIHVMVEPSDDVYLDVEGKRSIDDILFDADIDTEETECNLEYVDEATLRKWVRRGLVPITPEMMTRANLVADQVLAAEDGV